MIKCLNNTALQLALVNNNNEIVNLLLQRDDIDVNSMSILTKFFNSNSTSTKIDYIFIQSLNEIQIYFFNTIFIIFFFNNILLFLKFLPRLIQILFLFFFITFYFLMQF